MQLLISEGFGIRLHYQNKVDVYLWNIVCIFSVKMYYVVALIKI